MASHGRCVCLFWASSPPKKTPYSRLPRSPREAPLPGADACGLSMKAWAENEQVEE